MTDAHEIEIKTFDTRTIDGQLYFCVTPQRPGPPVAMMLSREIVLLAVHAFAKYLQQERDAA